MSHRERPSFALVVVVATLCLLAKLLSTRSENAWVLGFYSLPRLVAVAGALLWLVFFVLLWRRFAARTPRALLAVSIPVLLAGTAVELGAHVYGWAEPAYDALFLEPDAVVGWKHVADMKWTWAGDHWYARDFSVPTQFNSSGFRDLERARAKPTGTVRVALLGDSMVEALQVPFEKTAGQLLEKRLREGAQVLNFGVSNYGVGQYLLMWEGYARSYQPDYVFAFVGDVQVSRTVNPYATGAFSATREQRLSVRPTFALENGRLARRAALDLSAFAEAQERVRASFGGERTRRRAHPFFLGTCLERAHRALLDLQPPSTRVPEPVEPAPVVRGEDVLAINILVLDELGASVRASGAAFVVVDFSVSNGSAGSLLPDTLERFCKSRGFGYIALDRALVAANEKGIATHWKHDGHFNEAGNEIFAAAMLEWLAPRVAPGH